MAFSNLSVFSNDKCVRVDFDNLEAFKENGFDEAQQMIETAGILKLNENLYLGICAEDVRDVFTRHPPKNMFDKVACFSTLDKAQTNRDPFLSRFSCRRPVHESYHLIGEVPQQDLERDLPSITLDHNPEILGDGEHCFVDFHMQLPKLLEILDSYIVEGQRVLILINCYAGVFRSPALAMGFLMKQLNISADESRRKIMNVRACADPRETFINVLKKYFAEK